MTETLGRIRSMSATLKARAAEFESARRLPDDVIKDLTGVGAMRMLVPAKHGGPAMRLPDALAVIEELARADGSVGWTVGQVTLAQLIFSSFPEAAREEIYASGPDALGAGAVAPKGRAADEDGHWRVTGQWPFVTGCPHAAWVYLTCVVVDGRAVRTGPGGAPVTRMVVLPAGELEIVDTWHVMGLRGTASHDVRVSGVRCPDVRSSALSGDANRFRVAQAGLLISAVNVGLAQGALDEVIELATDGKRPAFSRRRLAESPLFQDRLGEAQMTCAAARALLREEAGAVAAAGTPGPLERSRLRATSARVASLTASVVDTAHALAGGSAVYESSPLQRRLRDMRTSTQHFVNGRDYYGVLGALLVGAEVDPALP